MVMEIARAKLNLALHVRARRADGYHELETLFAFVEDGDGVTVEPAQADSFTLSGPFAAVLSGEGDNLVTRRLDPVVEWKRLVDARTVLLNPTAVDVMFRIEPNGLPPGIDRRLKVVFECRRGCRRSPRRW